MVVIDGIKNFLFLVNDNWTAIIVIVGVVLAFIKKVNNYRKLSTEQKIEIAWSQLKESILGWCSEAEAKWTIDKQLGSAGQIKRSEVVAKVFEQYPILQTITNQEEVLKKIDDIIDEALDEVRKVVTNVDNELNNKGKEE